MKKNLCMLLCALLTLALLLTACSSGKAVSDFPSSLAFTVQLPDCVSDRIRYDLEEREYNGEKIQVVHAVYQGESGDSNLVTFEQMSSDSWTKMQEEGGPLPVELGTFDEGITVVMYPLQSNPYEPDSDDAKVTDQFASERKTITDTFTFSKQ